MNRITQQDIADHVGVSRNCVFKALKGLPGVSEATRRRIFETAAELGYDLPEEDPRYTSAGSVLLIAASGTLLNQYWAHFIQGLESSVTHQRMRLDIHLLGDTAGALRPRCRNRIR